MRVTIFDYGAGNLHSLHKALGVGGARVRLETDPSRCIDADVLVLPGVGAFTQAASRLLPARVALRDALRGGLPAVGICLGMQLLFGSSDEGTGAGIGLLDGSVIRLRATRVPQIGWNTLEDARDPLLELSGLDTAYFANGYVCRPADPDCVVAWSTHEGHRFPAMIRAYRTVGFQFHPEKSSVAGVRLLQAALEEIRR